MLADAGHQVLATRSTKCEQLSPPKPAIVTVDYGAEQEYNAFVNTLATSCEPSNLAASPLPLADVYTDALASSSPALA